MLGSLIRHGLQRWRRGRRYPIPEYGLFLPQVYRQEFAAAFEEAAELHAGGWLRGSAAVLQPLARCARPNAAACALLGQVLLAAGHDPAAHVALAHARELEPRLARDLI